MQLAVRLGHHSTHASELENVNDRVRGLSLLQFKAKDLDNLVQEYGDSSSGWVINRINYISVIACPVVARQLFYLLLLGIKKLALMCITQTTCVSYMHWCRC